MAIARIAPGVYRVDHDGRNEIVFVAGAGDRRWAFWNGRVFRPGAAAPEAAREAPPAARGGAQALTSPMPATVIKVLVGAGAAVKKGDTLLVVEAMKMEWPIRALGDARVTAVHCREGELVQPDQTLVDLE